MLLLLLACVPRFELSEPRAGATHTADAPSESGSAAAAPTGFPTLLVDCEGGGDFTSITDAIAEAEDGDWIAVAPCTYRENIDLKGKSLWIESTDGAEVTTLDANGGRALNATQGTGDGAAFVGFTIENADDSTGAVVVELSALRLQDVLIRDSQAGYGIVYASAGDVELINVEIDESNVISSYGVYASRGAVVADQLIVRCNGRENAFHTGHGSFFIEDSELDCSVAYSMYNEHSVGRIHRSVMNGGVIINTEDDHYYDVVTFENVHITGALAATYGKVVLRNSFVDGNTLSFNQVSTVEIQNTILAHSNCPIVYAYDPLLEADEEAPDPTVTVAYNNFFDVNAEHCDGVTTYSGTEGNLAVDPRFTNESGGDYTLRSASPLIDAGNPDAAHNDLDGSVNDIGLYGGLRSMGGVE
jgi:hypothetical protein